MSIYNAIVSRRSVRHFIDKPIYDETISKLLTAATMAPSGKNGQPWKFYVINKDMGLIQKISALSVYRKWLSGAACFIVVFLDKAVSYDYVKDIQAIGASIQNILLASYELGIGSCWIGEILRAEKQVKALLEIHDENLELMAVVALGYTDNDNADYTRKDISEVLLGWK